MYLIVGVCYNKKIHNFTKIGQKFLTICHKLSKIVKNCQKLSKIVKKCPTRTKFVQKLSKNVRLGQNLHKLFSENRTIFFLRGQKFVNFWLMSPDRITCSSRFWRKKQQKNRLKKVVYRGGFYQWACEMRDAKISFFWIKIFINF